MLDLALILAVFPGLLVLGAGVALVVLCGSRGPVFFRQRRVGYKGREFGCYKFRTMHVMQTPVASGPLPPFDGQVPMTKLDARAIRLILLGALLRHGPITSPVVTPSR
jgi:lipopolysaccharide/colanic/teichoic acid biosynthesis glycosyltransferase